MPLQISRLREEDILAFASADEAAMKDWPFAQAMDMASLGGEPRRQMIERWTRQDFRNDDEVIWLKVTDTELGDQLIAAALWRFYPEQRADNSDVTSAPAKEIHMAEESKEEEGGKGQQDASKEHQKPNVLAVSGEIGRKFRDEHIRGRPHYFLHILITDPAHQRRGAGSMLVKWGCDRADERGVLAALHASDAGLPIYLKFGFEVRSETPLDLRPFGVDATDVRRGMLREPKGSLAR